jgi:protein-disulfide isomerase
MSEFSSSKQEESPAEGNSPKTRRSFSAFINDLSPRHSFWFGVMIGAEAITFIGMIVFGIVVFSKDNPDGAKANQAGTQIVRENDPGAEPTISGTIDMASLTNIRGEGDITIVEYSDTECPFCKRFHETLIQVTKEFEGKVRWGYKHFPLESLHAKARREANASECAAEQGKFWPYIDLIFERTPANDGLMDEQLFAFASEVGLNRADFDSCLESAKYNDKVQADINEVQALGGTGTPFSVIVDNDGEILGVIPGAQQVETVRQQIQGLI